MPTGWVWDCVYINDDGAAIFMLFVEMAFADHQIEI